MQQGLSRMISAATLSDEYRPESLLPKENTIIVHQECVPKDIASVEKYLEQFIAKLTAQKPTKKTVSAHIDQSTLATSTLKQEFESREGQINDNNPLYLEPHSITRLKKVGAKSFAPRSAKEINTNYHGSFIWHNFKQEQKRSIEKLSTRITPEQIDTDIQRKLTFTATSSKQEHEEEIINKLNKQTISKFGVYGGWHWEEDLKDPNIFYLVKDISKQKITVFHQEQQGLVKVSTTKQNMLDNNIVAIMLEIARNVQRYSNNNQSVNTIGLKREYDKEIIHNLTRHINALNEGIRSAKNIQDQAKMLKVNLLNDYSA